MKVPPKLTDEEICRKFEITVDHPGFATAKALSHNREDRVICQVPELACPHCGHEFTATYSDIDPENGDEVPCEGCERIIFVLHIDILDLEDAESSVTVTLSTHNPKGE